MRISDWSSDVCSSDLRRAEMELAAGETDRKADRYGFIGLMIAERMQACGNPVEASCCDHRRLLDRAIPCAMIIVNQLAGTAVQERFIVFDDVTQVRSDLIAERRGMLEIGLRSEERRVGKRCGSPCRSRGGADQ